MSTTPANGTRNRRKLARLVALGLGLAIIGRKRHMRRHLMAGTYAGGFGRFGPGRFGHGPWDKAGGQQPMTLPPFIEATLKAWHDRAHGIVPPAQGPGAAEQSPASRV